MPSMPVPVSLSLSPLSLGKGGASSSDGGSRILLRSKSKIKKTGVNGATNFSKRLISNSYNFSSSLDYSSLDKLEKGGPGASGPAGMNSQGSAPPALSGLFRGEEAGQDEYYCFNSEKLCLLRENHSRSLRMSSDYIPVPPQLEKDKNKITVVLDLDETLIHSIISPRSTFRKAKQDQPPAGGASRRNSLLGALMPAPSKLDEFELTLSDGEVVKVLKRPNLDEFLAKLSEKFEVMTFTAGLKQYAEPVLDCLDPENKIFRHRFYRDSCLFSNGYYVKDLQKVNRDLKRTVLIDNNLCCFIPQLSNGIPISSFYDDPKDTGLSAVLDFLLLIESQADIRPTLDINFKMTKTLEKFRNEIIG